MDTTIHLQTATLEEANKAREEIVARITALQAELGAPVKRDNRGAKMEARLYQVWYKRTVSEVQILQQRAGKYKNKIRELRREQDTRLASIQDTSDHGLLKKASDLLVNLLKDDVEFDESERALIRVIRSRTAAIAAGEQ